MTIGNLNEKQKIAVENHLGPLLILAGAGSGKTKVLTEKVAYLINKKDVAPENILAITFTNKAAKEMKDRTYSLVGAKAYDIQISTFHSFGLKIIKDNFKELGYEKNFTILDSDDSVTVIKKILKDFNLDVKRYNPKMIKNNISSAKNELIDYKSYSKFVNDDMSDVTNRVYKKYQDSLIKNNSLDFDDLLLLPIILFKNNINILKKYQEQYKYIFIDEYQDTNEAQYRLSKMISEKYQNICVVGDNDQSIYSWRGANYKNILNFEKDYNNSKTILLEQNYRSTQTILKAANSLIQNNKQRKEKNLWTDNEKGAKIKYIRAYDEKDEAGNVLREIKILLESGVSLKDIAVLYRTNAQSRAIEESFLTKNIPYRIVGAHAFYNRKEIKDLMAYLKLLYNQKDDVSTLRVINYPKRGIGEKALSLILEDAALNNCSIFEAISGGKEIDFKKIILDIIEEVDKVSLTELVDLILDKSTIRETFKNEKTLEADIRLENLEEFKSITKAFEESKGIVSLEDFLMEISLVSDLEDKKDEVGPKATLMTMHAVKGLEFKYVFVIGVEENIFPHINSIHDSNEIEEERRLCYVAMTRAKKRLFILNTLRRTLFGKTMINNPSRFIKEIDKDYLEVTGRKKPSAKFSKENKFNKTTDLKVGDKINHDIFGSGVIVEIDKSIAKIAFKGIGIKSLMKKHKSIRKE